MAHPLLVKIGLISHWGVIAFSRLSIGISWRTIPFQVLLMAALAFASYRYVESPLRKLRWSANNVSTIAMGIGVLIAAGLLLLTFRQVADQMYLGKFKSEDFRYVQDKMSCELMSLNGDRSQWRSCLERSGMGPISLCLGIAMRATWCPASKPLPRSLGLRISAI